MRLNGKIAVVTGGARGLGEEITRVFVREGARVYILDMRVEEGEALAEELGRDRVAFIKADVTAEENWIQAVDTLMKKEGKLDILINNAGISSRIPFEELPLKDWESIMAVNVTGVFLGMKHVIPAMRRGEGGVIINMSSIAGLVGHATSSEVYIASKGAVTLLTKGVAVHYAKDNIRVNSVHPSTVNTPMVAAMHQQPELKKARIEEIPIGRLATTEDVANAVLFLASDEAAFITGVSLPVDGGLTAY